MGKSISYVDTLAAAARPGLGGIVLFAADVDGQLWYRTRTEPDGGWRDWVGPRWNDQQAPADWLACADQNDGRLMLLMSDDRNWIWSCAESRPGGGWGEWQGPGIAGQEHGYGSICASPQGKGGGLEAWTVDGACRLWTIRQRDPAGAWGGWQGPGFDANSPDSTGIASARAHDGRLVLFVHHDGPVWIDRQIVAGGDWSGWRRLEVGPSEMPRAGYAVCAAAEAAPLGVRLWVLDAEGLLWTTFEENPGGAWAEWSGPGFRLQPEPFKAMAAAGGEGGGSLLVAVGYEGALWTIGRLSPAGGWDGWTPLDPPPGDDGDEEGMTCNQLD